MIIINHNMLFTSVVVFTVNTTNCLNETVKTAMYALTGSKKSPTITESGVHNLLHLGLYKQSN